MIQITPHIRIFVALEDIDFRKGIDGLAAACRQRLTEDPFSGTLFLFRNRQQNALKLLVFDGQGFWLCTKRLSKGKFHWWPDQTKTSAIIEAHELQTLLWNEDLCSASFSEKWRKF